MMDEILWRTQDTKGNKIMHGCLLGSAARPVARSENPEAIADCTRFSYTKVVIQVNVGLALIVQLHILHAYILMYSRPNLTRASQLSVLVQYPSSLIYTYPRRLSCTLNMHFLYLALASLSACLRPPSPPLVPSPPSSQTVVPRQPLASQYPTPVVMSSAHAK